MMLAIVGFVVLALVISWHFRLSRAIAPHDNVPRSAAAIRR